MAEIVNLRRVRKARARADADKAAEINRAAFGRGKAEKAQAKAVAAEASRRLDGHRRATSATDEPDDTVVPRDA